MPALAATGATALAPMTWGTTYIVATTWLPPDRPLLAAVGRALPAGLLLLALTRTFPRGAWWGRAAILGALNIGVFFALLFLAAQRLPGGVAATVGAVQPLIVAGLAWPLLRERPGSRRVVAGVAGVAGVAVLVLRPDAGLDPAGVAAALAGAASMAAGVVLTKRWGRPDGVGVLAFTAWQLVAGGLLLAVLTPAVEGLPPGLGGGSVAALAYLGLVGTVLAYSLWFAGIGRLPAAAVSLLGLLSPVVAVLLGALAAAERLDPVQVAGVLTVLAAVLVGQLPASGGTAAARRTWPRARAASARGAA
ncbi:MAG TPA: EamA family transporter [Solirubrobacteraceae bacterium]|nr:EamA family transporter [Solirubrobacteraceae bacterium]